MLASVPRLYVTSNQTSSATSDGNNAESTTVVQNDCAVHNRDAHVVESLLHANRTGTFLIPTVYEFICEGRQ